MLHIRKKGEINQDTPTNCCSIISSIPLVKINVKLTTITSIFCQRETSCTKEEKDAHQVYIFDSARCEKKLLVFGSGRPCRHNPNQLLNPWLWKKSQLNNWLIDFKIKTDFILNKNVTFETKCRLVLSLEKQKQKKALSLSYWSSSSRIKLWQRNKKVFVL